VAETSLAQHLTAIEYSKASLEADILSRKAQLRQAKANLEQMLAGSRTQEIREANAAVRQAQSDTGIAHLYLWPPLENARGVVRAVVGSHGQNIRRRTLSTP